MIKTCQALDLPQPDGPTIIKPWWSLWIWNNWRTFSINDSYGWRSIFFATLMIFSLSSGYLIVGIEDPGKTPCKRFESKGISSAISLGTIVSQTERSKIFCSNSWSYLPSIAFASLPCFFKFPIYSLFILPALTKTLFKALKPKS